MIQLPKARIIKKYLNVADSGNHAKCYQIYKMQQKTAYPGYALNTNYDNTLSSITLMEIAA